MDLSQRFWISDRSRRILDVLEGRDGDVGVVVRGVDSDMEGLDGPAVGDRVELSSRDRDGGGGMTFEDVGADHDFEDPSFACARSFSLLCLGTLCSAV